MTKTEQRPKQETPWKTEVTERLTNSTSDVVRAVNSDTPVTVVETDHQVKVSCVLCQSRLDVTGLAPTLTGTGDIICIPCAENLAPALVEAVKKALAEGKKQGRQEVCVALRDLIARFDGNDDLPF